MRTDLSRVAQYLFALILLLGEFGCTTVKYDWEEAEKTDTITAYEGFLQKHSEAEQAGTARRRLAELHANNDWSSALRTNTIAAYEEFLQKHPDAQQAIQAKNRLSELVFINDWSGALSKNTLSEYRNFIDKYPQAEEARLAKIKIEELDSNNWREVRSSGAIASLDEFIRQYPASAYVDDAKRQRAKLQEELEWKLAKEANSSLAIQEFLKRYPSSEFSKEARLNGSSPKQPLEQTRAASDWSAAIMDAFEKTGSDINAIKAKASTYRSATSWYTASMADVSLAGAGACGLPVSGYVALPAEFLYLMRQIYDSSLGLGFLIYGDATKDDFATILGVWSEEIGLDNETLDKIYHSAERIANEVTDTVVEEALEQAVNKAWQQLQEKPDVSGVGSLAAIAPNRATAKASTKVVSRLIARKTGAKVAGKLSTKVATKTGAKIGTKYAAKAATAWIPVVSGAVCGGINAWIMNGIMSASEKYWTTLKNYRDRRYR